MRRALPALVLTLLLALPAALHAAEAAQPQEANEPQDPAFGPKRTAAPRPAVPFPGPTTEQLSRSGVLKTGAQGVVSGGQPGGQPGGQTGTQTPKSTKAMYGDIVIHK
ncbi:MAG: hypothetical protein HY916_08640 [Desulfovibrio sp.]|jgi:hypothetical protein|nr:hypothetical protein [Desulfovibrio sp.]